MTIMRIPSVKVCMASLYGGPGHVCVYESLELRGGFVCVWGSCARAYREVGSAGGMEVVGGRKHHHDQAEGEDGLHAPGLAIVDLLRQLVGTAADGCEGIGIDLQSTASQSLCTLATSIVSNRCAHVPQAWRRSRNPANGIRTFPCFFQDASIESPLAVVGLVSALKELIALEEMHAHSSSHRLEDST